MGIDLIFKVAGIGIITAVLHILLDKSGRSEQAWLVSIAGLVIAMLLVFREVSTLLEAIKGMFGF